MKFSLLNFPRRIRGLTVRKVLTQSKSRLKKSRSLAWSNPAGGGATVGRVLVVNQYALPRSQGGMTRHVDILSRLSGWSHKIIAGDRNYTSQEKIHEKVDGFVFLRVPPQEGSALARFVGWSLMSLQSLPVGLVGPRPDVILASSPHLFALHAALLIARLRRVPIVMEVRDLWPESFVAAGFIERGSRVHRIFEFIEKSALRRADWVVGVAQGWEPHMRRVGVDMDRYSVVPNGADVSDLACHEDRESVRAEFGLAGPVAIYAGAHGAKDGIGLILDAAKELVDVTFLIVGDGRAKAELVARAHAERLSNVRFFDPVPKAELPRLYLASDVGVHSCAPLDVYDVGMSPNKIYDYLAAGLPVVSNGGESAARVFGGVDCGVVCGPYELASAIRAVVGAPTSQKTVWKTNSVGLASSTYSRTAAADSYLNVFRSVMRR